MPFVVKNTFEQFSESLNNSDYMDFKMKFCKHCNVIFFYTTDKF